ncbi:EAL domain-containing protein [Sulfurimonas sp.]
MSDEILFAPEEVLEVDKTDKDLWDVLVVDDDKEVHSFTKLALHDFVFNDKKLKFTSAYSAKDAIEIIEKKKFAIILLDVVMESSDAGLKVVDYIRHDIKNSLVRIIIRTGQPGQAPERFVIDHYDINDYKEKTELTTERLYTTVRTALSQYKQLLELENKKDELYHSLSIDSLTGLPNRFKLNKNLDSEILRTLLLIDIDGFSLINDAYGFDTGDQVLLLFRDRLREISDKFNLTLYHITADVFAVLITEENDTLINQIVSEIREVISENIFDITPLELRLNVTIGVVKNDIGNMIQKAEIAVREARTISRNRVQYYSDDLKIIASIHDNNKWTKWLHDALISDNVIAYYQPIVKCSTNKIVKYEVLVRLRHEDTIYTPINFLGAARHAGLLHHITKKMVEKSFEMFSNNSLSLSINLTDVDLMEKDFVDFVEKKRKSYNMDVSRIHFELLEENSLFGNSIAQANLDKLIKFGYQISIDDFGVQCSNFAQLGTIPLESIKIDGSFIKNIDSNNNSRLVSESIVLFAQKKNINTVAEFVHSKIIYDIVKEMGVDYVQGYFFGEPKPELIDEPTI